MKVRARTGFTLTEVLIAMVVLALAMIPFMLSLSTSSRAVGGTREYLSALGWAQQTLEELRRAAFRKPTQATLPPNFILTLDQMVDQMATDPQRVREENGVRYERTVKLDPTRADQIPAGQPDLRSVQIKITWKPVSGGFLTVSQEYQLSSLVGSSTQP